VAIGVGPFVNSFSSELFALLLFLPAYFTWPGFQISLSLKSIYPFAANCRAVPVYASRQAVEQKCTNSLPSRRGMETSSATCVPHTGSRTSRREVPSACGALNWSASCDEAAVAPRKIHRIARRISAMLQETTSSQNRNLNTRERKFIDSFQARLKSFCLQFTTKSRAVNVFAATRGVP
jgi:hypothetical protein